MATLNEVLAQIEELKTIKSDLKEAIIAQGGEVADNTPFEDYAYLIGNLDTNYSHGGCVVDVFGDIDENGVLQATEAKTELVYSLPTEIKVNGFRNRIRYNNSIISLSFPNVEVTKSMSFYYTTYQSPALEQISFEKLKRAEEWSFCGVCGETTNLKRALFPNLEESDGNYTFNAAFNRCSSLVEVNLSKLKSITNGQNSFTNTFSHCTSLQTMCFDSLETVVGSDSLNYTFFGCTQLTQNCVFPKLKTVTGSGSMDSLFKECKILEEEKFPMLETVNGHSCMAEMFYSCLNLARVQFPKLTSITGTNACWYMFKNCSQLESIDFSSLETISGEQICRYMFSKECTSLNNISFPKLVTIGGTEAFVRMFDGVTTEIAIHFRTDMQSVVEALDGYSDKFGATNGTIYFDL